MDSHIRSSISRLICDMSAQQEDVLKNCSLWKPSAAKLADMELKYASPVSVSMKGSCRPWNYPDYLERLHTFREPSRWFAKPSGLSPLQCALLGWSCDLTRRDGLVCMCCKAVLVHNTIEDPLGDTTREKLTSGHAVCCGWGNSVVDNNCISPTATACAASFMDVPGAQSATSLAEQVVTRVASIISLLATTTVASDAPALCISLRGLLPACDPARSVSVCWPATFPALSALNQKFQELDNRMNVSSNRSSLGQSAWFKCEAAVLLRGALSWLVEEVSPQATTTTTTSSSNEEVDQVVRAALALALSGWSASSLTPTSTLTNTAAESVPVPKLVTLPVCGVRAVCCNLCGRSVSLLPNLEPLSQHRYFCPVINAQSEVPLWLTTTAHACCREVAAVNGAEKEVHEGVQGWQCNLRALCSVFLESSAASIKSSSDRRASGSGDKKNDSNSSSSTLSSPSLKHSLESTEGSQAGQNNDVSPEQAYKRIRSVLAMASARS